MAGIPLVSDAYYGTCWRICLEQEPKARNSVTRLCPVTDIGAGDRFDPETIAMPPDVYQQRATECLRYAESAADIDDRTTWRELALCWLRLSEHADKFRNGANRSDTPCAA